MSNNKEEEEENLSESEIKDKLSSYQVTEEQREEGQEKAEEKYSGRSGRVIVKPQLCGDYCGGCPHGPYSWLVDEEGWHYIGLVGGSSSNSRSGAKSSSQSGSSSSDIGNSDGDSGFSESLREDIREIFFGEDSDLYDFNWVEDVIEDPPSEEDISNLIDELEAASDELGMTDIDAYSELVHKYITGKIEGEDVELQITYDGSSGSDLNIISRYGNASDTFYSDVDEFSSEDMISSINPLKMKNERNKKISAGFSKKENRGYVSVTKVDGKAYLDTDYELKDDIKSTFEDRRWNGSHWVVEDWDDNKEDFISNVDGSVTELGADSILDGEYEVEKHD